jgi:hypothetical protein
VKSPASALRGTSARTNVSAKTSPFSSTCSSLVPSANTTVTFIAGAPRVASPPAGQAHPPTPPRKCRLAAVAVTGISTRCGKSSDRLPRPGPPLRATRFAPLADLAGSMTKNGTPATETSPNLWSVTVSSRSSSRRNPRRLSAV